MRKHTSFEAACSSMFFVTSELGMDFWATVLRVELLFLTIYNLQPAKVAYIIISGSIRLPSSQPHLRCGKRSS